MRADLIPVVDLFAGPGGLGEGFSAFRGLGGNPAFRIVLSIEMDVAAHRTLELRSFFRQFERREIPEAYYKHLQGRTSRDSLFERYPTEAAAAKSEAWNVELGRIGPDVVDERIRSGLRGATNWVLCGGPPCQAYSLIGRSRNRGIDASDHRLYLYREYLRILSHHRPSVFIFENVKGLLSSRLGSDGIFRQILEDLTDPRHVTGHGGPGRYQLYSLVVPPRYDTLDGKPTFDYRDFIIKCEEFGIPQSRHRVIILGIREDCVPADVPRLLPSIHQVPASHVLDGLPPLRSGLSRTTDSKEAWRAAVHGFIDGHYLDGVPHGKGSELREKIKETLQRLRLPDADRGGEFVACRPKIAYRSDWYCDNRIAGVCNHASRPHIAGDLYRYLFAASYARLYGRSPELRDFPQKLLPKHKNAHDAQKLLYFDDRFRVQLGDKPATTITSHIAKDGHYYIHYDETQCRSLTVREAARLQTFPDNYLFCGTRTQQYVQVGNAVPPLLAERIASVVATVLAAGSAAGGGVC